MPETLTKRMIPSGEAFPPDYRCILSEAYAFFYLKSSFACVACRDAAMAVFVEC